jgi:hypothetical protein
VGERIDHLGAMICKRQRPQHCGAPLPKLGPGPFRRSYDGQPTYGTPPIGFLRMWSIYPAQIKPIVEAMRPDHDEVADASEILVRAQQASWGPIQYKNELHDRTTYRYFWFLLKKAKATGMALPGAAQKSFFRLGGPRLKKSEWKAIARLGGRRYHRSGDRRPKAVSYAFALDDAWGFLTTSSNSSQGSKLDAESTR